jgi:membrane-bound lytic murein transglycosylase MltF
MTRTAIAGSIVLFFVLHAGMPVQGDQARGAAVQQSAVQMKAWTGDLDGMLARRLVRALVVHSKTYYFVERGEQRGIAFEMLKAFEDELNRRHPSRLRTNVVFIPVTRGELLPALLAGRGDLAVSGIAITTERDARVDFSMPTTTRPVNEIVVAGPRSPALKVIDDLSGQEVFVRPTSSYWEHLQVLNQRFAAAGKAPVRLRPAPEDLEDEDLLEMTNAGLVGLVVVSDVVVNAWTPLFKELKPRLDLVVHAGSELAWMFRPGSPKLKAEVDAFVKTHRQGTTFGNTLIKRYAGSGRFVKNATAEAELKKFQSLVALFKKYASTYDMDFLLMMAQGYQESRLDQQVKSPVGAIGVMQVMPATGKELKVGDISQVESNVHAGVKYIRFVVDRYFANEPMTTLNKGLFAFAAYNAGPARIRQLRAEALKRGLDPNVWFNNVEVVAADRIGAETVTYVSNIYKYYVAYRLVLEDMERGKSPPAPQTGAAGSVD